jgi:hypothetical protein
MAFIKGYSDSLQIVEYLEEKLHMNETKSIINSFKWKNSLLRRKERRKVQNMFA